MTALYSAASQMKQLDEVETGLRDLEKVLKKPKVVDFMETSLISRTGKAKLLMTICKEAGMLEFSIQLVKDFTMMIMFLNCGCQEEYPFLEAGKIIK